MMSFQHIVGLFAACSPKGDAMTLCAVRPVIGGEGRVLVRVRHDLISALASLFDGITPDDSTRNSARKDNPIGAGGMLHGAVLGGFRLLDGLPWQSATTAELIGISSKTDDFNNAEYGLENTAHGCQSRRERQTRLRSRT